MPLPKQDSLELRILELVRDHYPITKDELRRRLGVSELKVELALKRLLKDGLVEFDVLPDKVFVRLKVIPVGRDAKKNHKKAQEQKKKDGPKDPLIHDYSYM
jgi:DNA-binding transcriptional ArsR family regulator